MAHKIQTVIVSLFALGSFSLFVYALGSVLRELAKKEIACSPSDHIVSSCVFCGMERTVKKVWPDFRSEVVDRGSAALTIMRGGK